MDNKDNNAMVTGMPADTGKIEKIKKLLRRPIVIVFVTAILLGGAFFAGASLYGSNGEEPADAPETAAKQVKTVVIGAETADAARLTAVGIVKPDTKIDITANARGTVSGYYVEVGRQVAKNALIASLSDDATAVNLANARTNYANTQNNLAAVRLIAAENLRQAGAGLATAEESVAAAKVGLKTAQDNLANSGGLRGQNNLNTQTNAITSFGGYLNTIDNALDQTDFILKVDGDKQLADISPVLGVKDLASLDRAKSDYFNARQAYEALTALSPDTVTIETDMAKLIKGLQVVNLLMDDMVTVFDNTISSADFSETERSAQISAFIALRGNILSSISAAQAVYQSLGNLDLVRNQETEALENAVAAAERQVAIASAARDSAATAREVAAKNNELQILSAESAVDGARAQLSVAEVQASQLAIRAPLSGQITETFVEAGSVVTPGQKIAELSRSGIARIELDLPATDAARLTVGAEAKIVWDGRELIGAVSRIYPAADPVTKKVRVEVAYDNKDGELVAESFVSVSLPAAGAGADGAIFVPLKAVTVTSGDSFVFAVQDGTAKKAVVTLGRTEGQSVEILTGLALGDVVIVEGGKNLIEGDKVEAVE